MFSADNDSYINRTETIIEQFGKDRTSRNSVLANLKMHSVRLLTDGGNEEPLLSICRVYFEKYSSKAMCFKDLRPHVASLNQDNQRLLLRHMGSCASQLAPSSDANNVCGVALLTFQ